MAFFIGDRDYTEETRNVDDMLNRFASDRKNLVSLLSTQSKTQKIDVWEYLSLDRECLFSMGKRCRLPLNALCECNDANSCMTNFHICPMCKNMKRIIDFSKIHPKEPFLIECGENVGSFLIYTETPIRLHSSSEESKTLNNDSFTNCLLIHYFLQEEVGDIPTIPIVHVGFVCGDKGYTLAENTPLTFKNIQVYPEFLEAAEPNGKLSPTSKVDARRPFSGELGESILMQLLAALKFLSKYNFSYGTPSYSSIKFKKEPVSYVVLGVHISGPISLKICNFENSSIDVGNDSKKSHLNLRLLNKSSLGELEAKRSPKVKEEKTYKIKNPDRDPKDAVITSYRKSMGEPNNSFDLYKFMIVLMSDRTFYISIVSNPKTLALWKDMWLPSEYEAITERLKDYHETNKEITTKDTLRILSDLTLSKDMLDTLWKKIK